jgi:hypothetical protein
MATRLRFRRAGAVLGWAALLACSGTSPLNAQQVRLLTHAALSRPTRMSIKNGQLHVSQRIGVVVGARLIVSFNPRFDAVTGVSYSPGYAQLQGAGSGFSVITGGQVLNAASEARYWLKPLGRTLSWEVHTGVGVVFGGQPAYQDLFQSSTVTAIVGTTVRYQIGGIVGLRVRIQDRLYRVGFGDRRAGSSSSPLQFSFGFNLPFFRPLS